MPGWSHPFLLFLKGDWCPAQFPAAFNLHPTMLLHPHRWPKILGESEWKMLCGPQLPWVETPNFLRGLGDTLSRYPIQMLGLGGWDGANGGERHGQENVRNTRHTGSAQGPGGRTPFGCQRFPIGVRSEQLFPLKIRKALKFPCAETEPGDFWLFPQFLLHAT